MTREGGRWPELLLVFLLVTPSLEQHVELEHHRAIPPGGSESTHIVASLLTLIALLVSFSFSLIWLALLRVEGLPAFAEDFADLACHTIRDQRDGRVITSKVVHTEADARVLLPHIFALLIGEEHIGGKTTFGRVGICGHDASAEDSVN